MTTFADGPAKGQTLMLKRSPLLLRVVQDLNTGKFDALDAAEDTPAENERLFAYRMVKFSGMVHLNRGRSGGSGFYGMAHYALVPDQPTDEIMRDNAKWKTWKPCEAILDELRRLQEAHGRTDRKN